jgi:hypothetical protein
VGRNLSGIILPEEGMNASIPIVDGKQPHKKSPIHAILKVALGLKIGATLNLLPNELLFSAPSVKRIPYG